MEAARNGYQCAAFLVLAVVVAGCEKSVPPPPVVKYLASEGFDYPVGKKLEGLAGGTGFAGKWEVGGFNVTNADDMVIANGSLTYPGLVSTGNRLMNKFTGRNQGVVRDLSFKVANGTRYLSFLLRPEGTPASLGLGHYFGIILYYGSGSEPYFGKPGGGVLTQYTVETRGGGAQMTTDVETKIGETAHIVIRADFKNGSDFYTMYVNPGPAEPAKGVQTAYHESRLPSLMIYAEGDFSLDEIRVAERYEDVVPPPSPTAPKPKPFIFF